MKALPSVKLIVSSSVTQILHHHCSSQCDTRNKTNLEIYTTHTVGLVNLVIIYVRHNRSPSDFCLIFWKTSAENCSWQERCVPNGTVFMCLNHCIYTGRALALNMTSVHTVYWERGMLALFLIYTVVVVMCHFNQTPKYILSVFYLHDLTVSK